MEKDKEMRDQPKKKTKNPFDSLLTYDWEVKINVGYLPSWLEELELEALILVSKTN
jgi:hypothetical protein